jgi:hypothetical protein
MKVYKLQYPDKETAIADLIAKGVYIETEERLSYGPGIHAIVEVGVIILNDATYDENMNEITAPVYAEGYHFDIMCEQEIDFDNAINPKNPKHTFA